MQNILAKIERIKTLVSLALTNDLFTLTQDVKADLSRVGENVSKIAAGVADVQIKQNKQELRVQDQEFRTVLDWLSPINFRAIQAETLDQWHQGTGQWLLDPPEFESWVDETGSNLWLPGMPGAGKTILAYVLRHHVNRPNADYDIWKDRVWCNF